MPSLSWDAPSVFTAMCLAPRVAFLYVSPSLLFVKGFLSLSLLSQGRCQTPGGCAVFVKSGPCTLESRRRRADGEAGFQMLEVGISRGRAFQNSCLYCTFVRI